MSTRFTLPRCRPAVRLALAAALMGVCLGAPTSVSAEAFGESQACGTAPAGTYGTGTSSISVPASGTYRVWSRIKAPDTINNSYWLQIGSCAYHIGNAAIPAGSWTWVDYKAGSTESKLNLTLTAGTHQVKFIGTEAGVGVDRLILTADQSCVPTGTGDNCATPVAVAPVGAGSHNDTAFTFSGSWSSGTGSGAYQSGDRYTSSAGASYTLTFTGTQAKVFATKAPHHGIMAVSIDGGAEVMVDTYSSTRADQVLVYTSPELAPGTHTIKVRATGTKSASSTGTVITGDRIDIMAATTPSLATGDLNGDGKVTITDLSILLSRWGAADATADLNKDGSVGITDLSILLSKWTG